MGRSGASCFKIISCGSDSAADRDDLQALPPPESKSSGDKRGWSFRKRSARHRVLSNTVTSTPSSGNKESPEDTMLTEPNSTVSEKPPNGQLTAEKTPSTQLTDEKPPTELRDEQPYNFQLTNEEPQPIISGSTNLSEAATATEDDYEDDNTPNELDIIVVQTSIRGFLARMELLKHKNVTKLQAAVRGHLVRKHAVGTLRCIQAIIKMQALVRARRASLVLDGSCIVEKPDEQQKNADLKSTFMGKENSGTKSHFTRTSVEKLLSNRFACQLLESTPRTRSINIKCDPLKGDSAWKWLERWMSVSAMEIEQPETLEITTDQQEKAKNKHSDGIVNSAIPPETNLNPTGLESGVEVSAMPCGTDESLFTCNAQSLDCQAESSDLLVTGHNLGKAQLDNVDEPSSTDGSLDAHLVRPHELNAPSEILTKNELITEKPKTSVEKFGPEPPEENRAPVGSRKASNPAFVAAQSKFEELSSATNSRKLTRSSSQDTGVESPMDASAADQTSRKDEIVLVESYAPRNSMVQIGGSECGTELSITSTLDSPDNSEVGGLQMDQNVEVSDDGNSTKINETIYIETKGRTLPDGDSSSTNLIQKEKCDLGSVPTTEYTEPANGVGKTDVEHKPVVVATDLQMQKSSPEASPRSHVSMPEIQGTPASQVSVKSKKTRTENSGSSNHKRRSLSASKQSPSNPNHISATSSFDQLPKEHKSGKGRNSSGSAKGDNVEQPPRDSVSTYSLPSYMQATESARAKAVTSSSPRSSPDVQNNDIYIKKRHSLPGSNGRQGSPRIQRSLSQAQQSAKGSGSHSPHEKKWQR